MREGTGEMEERRTERERETVARKGGGRGRERQGQGKEEAENLGNVSPPGTRIFLPPAPRPADTVSFSSALLLLSLCRNKLFPPLRTHKVQRRSVPPLHLSASSCPPHPPLDSFTLLLLRTGLFDEQEKLAVAMIFKVVQALVVISFSRPRPHSRPERHHPQGCRDLHEGPGQRRESRGLRVCSSSCLTRRRERRKRASTRTVNEEEQIRLVDACADEESGEEEEEEEVEDEEDEEGEDVQEET
eukprot:754290-Hanusia_phi.AAC.2